MKLEKSHVPHLRTLDGLIARTQCFLNLTTKEEVVITMGWYQHRIFIKLYKYILYYIKYVYIVMERN